MGVNSADDGVPEESYTDDRSVVPFIEVLGDQRRRHAVACAIDRTQPVALADLAEAVAVREHQGSITAIPEEEVDAIHLSLYHTHIPKLAEIGLVDYDPGDDEVRIAEPAETAERVLSLVTDGDGGR